MYSQKTFYLAYVVNLQKNANPTTTHDSMVSTSTGLWVLDDSSEGQICVRTTFGAHLAPTHRVQGTPRY
jgi:hypothetical protein